MVIKKEEKEFIKDYTHICFEQFILSINFLEKKKNEEKT